MSFSTATPVYNSQSQTPTGRLYNHGGVSNVTSGLNNRSLAETVVWCNLQRLTSVAAESDEMRRRRNQIEEAGRILQQAQARAERKWFRLDVCKSRDWERGMRLLREAKPDSLAPLERQLRSSLLEPNIPLSRPQSEAERERIVTELINKRSQLLQAERREFSEVKVLSEAAGRLLTYIPSENVADGASRYASKGFFDPYDTPPWDTWVYYRDNTLVSWVPTVVEPLVQAGIDANPVLCVNWADSA